VAGFGKANILLVVLWLGLAALLLREYNKVAAVSESEDAGVR
jgi:hypothetical protein